MFFLFLLAMFLILFLILLCITIQIQVENMHVTNMSGIKNWLQPNYKIYICFFLFGKIQMLKIKITEKVLKKLNVEDKVKNLEVKLINDRKNFDKSFFEIIKNIKIKVEQFEIEIVIGLENAALTALVVPIFSIILSLLIRKTWKENKKQYFKVEPIYQNKNILNLKINGIFKMKMIHIMHIIYILLKKRRSDNNVRTSDRRAYGYSYE